MQEAFIEAGAFQCGFCTPGFIMMVTQLLDEHPDPTDEQIKHYLSGNLCRCAAYPEIMEAVKLAAKKAEGRRNGLNREQGGMPCRTSTAGCAALVSLAQSRASGTR